MKKLFFACICSLNLMYPVAVPGASLDIETEYRLRGISLSNPDFDQFVRDNSAYYENRLRVTLDGSPVENIRIVTRIQALGLAGGSTEYTLVGGTNTFRYPNTGSSPWIENAFIQMDNVNNLPVTLLIGRQPFYYGNGFIFSDDELGFNALRAIWQFTDVITIDVFTAKIRENRFGENDFDTYGLVTTSKKTKSEWLIGIYLERDRTQKEFQGFPTSLIEKYFFEYYTRKNLTGAYYSINVAVQRGQVVYTDPTKANQKFKGGKFKIDKVFDYLKPMGFLLEGGLQSYGSNFTGPAQVHAAWGIGTGDSAGSVAENETFIPSLGHRFDGLERVGFGQFYAATLYDAFPTLPAGYTGLQVIKFGGSISPLTAMKITIDYFLFDAQQAPPGGAKELARELDFTLRFPYSTYITFDASYALFFPKDGIAIDGARATRYAAGVTARF